jgi:hypothetical protein
MASGSPWVVRKKAKSDGMTSYPVRIPLNYLLVSYSTCRVLTWEH